MDSAPTARRIAAAVLIAAASTACTTLEEEMQPVVDSLHTSEMNAAIEAAAPGKPPPAPPKGQM
jgi:hypothetical protein